MALPKLTEALVVRNRIFLSEIIKRPAGEWDTHILERLHVLEQSMNTGNDDAVVGIHDLSLIAAALHATEAYQQHRSH